DLEPESYSLTIWDLDRTFHADSFGILTLRALLDQLRQTFAGKTGVQYMHIDNPTEREWIRYGVETTHDWPPDAATHRRILEALVLAYGFEGLLDNSFKGHKRFSLEGAETMIAMMEELLENAAKGGVQECVIGMAHRGRLTLLANVIGKGVAQMFS